MLSILSHPSFGIVSQRVRASFPPEHDFCIYVTQFEEWFDVRKPFEIALSDLVDRIPARS
jgi:hypothetical protein